MLCHARMPRHGTSVNWSELPPFLSPWQPRPCRVRRTAAARRPRWYRHPPCGRRRSLHDDTHNRLASDCRAYLNSHWPCRSANIRGGTGGSSQRRRPRYVGDARAKAVDPLLRALACLLETRRDVTDSLLLPPSTKLAKMADTDHVIRRRFNDVSSWVKGPANDQ